MDIPVNLLYSTDHEWVKIEGDVAYVGITDYAQKELGDIVFLDVETVGEDLNSGDIFGSVEAVKTVSDLFLPINGKILELNPLVATSPDLVNTDPYGKGWIVKVEFKNLSITHLLNAEEYKNLLG
ncbi:glycine cleavage system protein GcvH [Apibacter adventoris]|uniref:glycine cleavage system protein GcvH n=1 Tax=Apibacter adventoris TaxID=1679466 RepID=UPI000CF604CC|nr:glycine cleavage system protein GcvH [Apibacter adventoris]PQL94507.1 glycine cleavage system protein H [Apibacter adventoris]